MALMGRPWTEAEHLLLVAFGRTAPWEAPRWSFLSFRCQGSVRRYTLPKNADATSLKVADCFQQSRTCEAAPRYNLHDVALPRTACTGVQGLA